MAGVLALLMGACASSPTPTTEGPIPGDRYAEAFAAAKDVLRENHFDLSRVDAARGIIETHPRSSSGLATPWIDHADSFSESVEGLVHRDRRRATVRFVPVRDAAVGVDPALEDQREGERAFRIEVGVEVERTYVLGRRADATSIRLTSRAIDPALVASGVYPVARSAVRVDDALAGRLAMAIEAKIPGYGGARQNPHSETGIE